MEAFLVYNGNAGGAAETDAEFYKEALKGAGYSPIYQVTKSEEELEEILPDARGLIVVVGGDGSLRAVATRVVGRDIPIALIPAGTANNVGHALGLVGDPAEVVQGLSEPYKLKVDVGLMRGPWGESYFLEGAGFGLYAEALSRYKPEEGKSVLRGAQTMLKLLTEDPTPRCRMRVNGEEEEGDYLLVEAMNTPAVGPRMPLAPEADMTDGKIDLVRVRAENRDSYTAYLKGMLKEELPELSSVQTDRVSRFEFFWDGFAIHQDAEYRDLGDFYSGEGAWVEVELLHHALEFWLPAREALKAAS